MNNQEKKSMSFKVLLMAVSACIAVLAAVLIALSHVPNAFAGDATSFNPASVAVQAVRGSSGTPVGSVIAWSHNTIPNGWLECNGQSTTGYPELAAVVGANVPDLRGKFIRGHSAGSGIDSGRGLLSSQTDSLKSHSHSISGSGQLSMYSIGGSSPYPPIWGGAEYGTYGNKGSASFSVSFSGTATAAGGSETRPINVAFKYIIKAQ